MRMTLIVFVVSLAFVAFAIAFSQKKASSQPAQTQGASAAKVDNHGLPTDPSSTMRICTVNTKVNCPLKQIDIATIAPRPEDVGSIDGMIKAWYDIVTVPKGSRPDWARDHSLYTPETRFLSVGQDKTGKLRATIFDHTMYASGVGPQIAQEGFYESEIHRVTQRFGQTAHVMSTYESRRTKDGPAFARGVNSIELFNDGSRWWITYAQWDEERPGNPLPKELMP